MKLFSIAYKAGAVNLSLLLSRVVFSSLMITHGLPKLNRLMNGEPFADIWGMGSTLSLILAVFAELVCSVLIFIGLGTRIAAVFQIITMAVAVFHVHANDPIGKKELALLYLTINIVFLLIGPGRYSVDGLISKGK